MASNWNPRATIAATSPDLPALFDDNSAAWMSYGELSRKISETAVIFEALPKNLIFCSVPRSVTGVTAYLAAAASGHAVAMIDPATPHLDDLIDAYRPRWIIAPVVQKFSSYVHANWNLPDVRLWRRDDDASEIHPELYLLLPTSGSTGSKKAVRLSYTNIADNTAAIIESLGLMPEANALLHLPLAYSFGLSVLHMQLAAGGRCLLTQHGMMSPEFWSLARAQKANLFPGVPYHYEMLAKLGLERLQAPELKTFLQAGGKLPTDLTQDFLQHIQKREGKFFIMYGQTEAGPRISCLPLHQHPEKIGSVGKALRGGSIATENDEIIYYGQNVMMGYAESRADLAEGDVMSGRLATGDLGRMDADDYLTITGRRQRFVKIFGQRIDMDDLERIAGKLAPAYAIETADKIVLVTMNADTSLSEKIRAHLAAETGLPPAWLEAKSMSEIPRQPNGKVDYRRMREQLS